MGDGADREDPFERVVQREERLRRRWRDVTDPSVGLRLVATFYGVCSVVWLGVLLAHGRWLGEPLWLFRLHVVVFALSVALGLVAFGFLAYLYRRHPEWVGLPHPD